MQLTYLCVDRVKPLGGSNAYSLLPTTCFFALYENVFVGDPFYLLLTQEHDYINAPTLYQLLLMASKHGVDVRPVEKLVEALVETGSPYGVLAPIEPWHTSALYIILAGDVAPKTTPGEAAGAVIEAMRSLYELRRTSKYAVLAVSEEFPGYGRYVDKEICVYRDMIGVVENGECVYLCPKTSGKKPWLGIREYPG